MTAFIAPEEPEGRWALYNEEYSGINGDAFLSEFAEEIRPYATDGHMVFKSVYSSMECEEVQAAMEGKKAVVLTGVVAECCVLATLMDAIDMGYEVVYLYDGIAGTSEKDEQMILRLAGYFAPVHVTVMSCAEYIAAISGDAGIRKTGRGTISRTHEACYLNRGGTIWLFQCLCCAASTQAERSMKTWFCSISTTI